MHTASVLLAEHDGRGWEWGHAVQIRHGIKHSVRRCAERCTRRRSANARSTRSWSRRGIYTKKSSNICRYVRSGHIIRGIGSTAGPLARGKEAVRTTLHLDRPEEEVGRRRGRKKVGGRSGLISSDPHASHTIVIGQVFI